MGKRNVADTPLAHLRGKVHNIWAGAVLHVLDKESIEKLLANVCLLLREGGLLFGTSVGSETAGLFAPTPDGKSMRYVHSPVGSPLVQDAIQSQLNTPLSPSAAVHCALGAD